MERFVHCAQCKSRILPDDDAGVCIKCGGHSRRYYSSWCCQKCGAEVGHIGNFFAMLFGEDIHNCSLRRQSQGDYS